jgi:hypothetical protein
MRAQLFGAGPGAVTADRVDALGERPLNNTPGAGTPGAGTLGARFDLTRGVVAGETGTGHDRRWLAVAASIVVVAGIAAVWAAVANRNLDEPPAPVQQPVTSPPPSNTSDNDTAAATTTVPGEVSITPGATWIGNVRTVPNDESGGWYDPPWDPIPIASGTVGWFEAGDNLPGDLAALRDVAGADADGLAGFFTCRDWTLDGDGAPTCTGLGGGNGIEHVTYGDQLGVGVELGNTDARTQLWAQAQGSLWGYDQVTEPPEPTIIDVGDIEGYSYRDGDQAYLAWEYQPGVVVWLDSNGLDDNQLADIAVGVRPVELPTELPLPLQLDDPEPISVGGGSNSLNAALKVGYLDGQLCAGIELWEQCVIPDAPAIVGVAVWGDGKADRFAAIVPTGTDATLRVNLYDQGWQTIPLETTGFGFDAATWDGNSDRILEAELISATGDTLADTGPLESVLPGSGETVAEGSSGVAWIVHRQDPQDPNAGQGPAGGYVGDRDSAEFPYCLLLSGPSEYAPLCPSDNPPVTGIGQHADYHNTLDLVEIATDVTTIQCDGVDMPTFLDPVLDGRRFAVTTCDNPTVN